MIRKALFFPTIIYNVVVDTFTTKTWYNRIDQKVVLGALPFRIVLPRLKEKENISGIVSLNQDFELHPTWYPTKDELARMNIELLRLPVEDYTGVPTYEQIMDGLQFISRITEQENGSVYVHCKAGRSRSAVLTAAYLIVHHGKSVEEAVEFLRIKRPQVWIGQKGRDQLANFYERRKSHSFSNSIS